jgi:putative proteasome-type protease
MTYCVAIKTRAGLDMNLTCFKMLRDNWGKKLREMFDSLEDPVWNGDATDIPLKKVGKHSPLRKISTPEEKLI